MEEERPLFFKGPSETIDALSDVYFPPYITLAHVFHAPEGWGIRSRVLKQYQFQYNLGGLAEYRIGERVYETKRGDLIFHRPGENHEITTPQGSPYVCISIVFHFGSAAFPIDSLLSGSHDMGNFTGHELEEKLTSLVLAYRQPGLASQFKAQSLLMDVLSELGRMLHERVRDESTATQRNNLAKMVLVKNHILQNYRENLQIRQLETLTGFSRDYLIEQFRKSFGMTPIQYLIHVRVEKAKELALHTGLSIGEIAERVGYSDVHTFGKMFKKKTGYSLSRFCSSLFIQSSYKEDDHKLP
ncbi:helix-turn-helix domain-containing protein [Cohnella sp. JJ-181]|uniref:helix-turn-helix domain-containing protein n=1 Tax=Cohnella rhizoplanae TaxID=2974897 RepID=UPI0022FF526D|nr:AraC family transcriptional regulator [Cohnella sp. JJ-181]CAI6084950.1 HTH-type transcriptional activator RhaR [Cohnella sp. JJ-181]